MELNKEKKDIIQTKGSVLVTANPGTGKTLLLAHKYVDLIKKGTDPEKILCLTFTKKARREIEQRIRKMMDEHNISPELSRMKIYTFHAYANELTGSEELSEGSMRYAIFRYMKEKKMLNYGNDYLIDKIVPRTNTLFRHLKVLNVRPEEVNLEQVRAALTGTDKYSKEEIDKFAEDFIDMFRHCEHTKKGMDFEDILLEMHSHLNREKGKFDFVLIDELQDSNLIQAEIALKSGRNFFAVGDKKQAIFGFQGGSILNFKYFEKGEKRILSENFRSSNQILDYAKRFFLEHTKEQSHEEELRNLRNVQSTIKEKPKIYELQERKELDGAVLAMVQNLQDKHEDIAVIARTNDQLDSISKALSSRGIKFVSTFLPASKDAKKAIIDFIKGILSNDPRDVRQAMMTPFFPCTLQEAFRLSEQEAGLPAILKNCPEFRDIRERTASIEDVNDLFKTKILPVAVAYGRDYLMAALRMHEVFQEALTALNNSGLDDLTDFLKASELFPEDQENEREKITLTTVHKAKGREFDAVIYIPKKTSERVTFQDDVTTAILKSKKIDPETSFEEEDLRIDFVAFTRAKSELRIITENKAKYANDLSEEITIPPEKTEESFFEREKRAYTLFLNDDFAGAKSLLHEEKAWIRNYVKRYFESLDHLSVTSLTDDPFDYFQNKIITLRQKNRALIIGSEVHKMAERLCKGEDVQVKPEFQPYKETLITLLGRIKESYPEFVETEPKIVIPISRVFQTDSDLNFEGFLDAVFRNGDDYMIVDWKTDMNEGRASKHRQQLEAYRRAYSALNDIPLEKIKVAIGFCSLRPTINTGTMDWKLDDKPPSKSAINTLAKKANSIISWKENPDLFFEQLMEKLPKNNRNLWQSIVQQCKKEIS